jgi:hypothetical protein
MNKLLIVLIFTCALPVAWAAGDPAPYGLSTLKGEVLEVHDVAAYTYLRLKTATGETWAAVNKSPVNTGSQVTIFDPTEMQDFESKSLNRTFPTIVFGTLGVEAGPATTAGSTDPAAPGAGTDLNQIHGSLAKTADVKSVKVAKAEGANARTVAEINADRLTLKDQPVTVRAQVVKVTTGVMGTNWVHLRDGSGSASDNSDDVLVTSKDEPKIGVIVVARGVVKTDVNLGSGYAYKVLVENASFEP